MSFCKAQQPQEDRLPRLSQLEFLCRGGAHVFTNTPCPSSPRQQEPGWGRLGERVGLPSPQQWAPPCAVRLPNLVSFASGSLLADLAKEGLGTSQQRLLPPWSGSPGSVPLPPLHPPPGRLLFAGRLLISQGELFRCGFELCVRWVGGGGLGGCPCLQGSAQQMNELFERNCCFGSVLTFLSVKSK